MLKKFNNNMYLCKNINAFEDQQCEEDLHTIEVVNETDNIDLC